MSTKSAISVQAKVSYNCSPVFNNTNLKRLIFSGLTPREQDRFKRVSRQWLNNMSIAQRAEISRVFPADQLKLVGGSLDSVPIRNIPTVERGFLSSLPDLAVGWVQVEPQVWTVHVFKRELSQDKTSRNTLVYYFSRLPESCELDFGRSRLQGYGEKIAIKTIPDELNLEQETIKPKIGFWEIEAASCSFEAPCCCCDSCCGCRPWNTILRMALSCCSTLTLSVSDDRSQRRRDTYLYKVSKFIGGSAGGAGPGGAFKASLGYQGAHYFPFTLKVLFSRFSDEAFKEGALDSRAIRYANLRIEPAALKKDDAKQGTTL